MRGAKKSLTPEDPSSLPARTGPHDRRSRLECHWLGVARGGASEPAAPAFRRPRERSRPRARWRQNCHQRHQRPPACSASTRGCEKGKDRLQQLAHSMSTRQKRRMRWWSRCAARTTCLSLESVLGTRVMLLNAHVALAHRRAHMLTCKHCLCSDSLLFLCAQ